MLHLSSKETTVVLQDYPKTIGSPVTCGIQRVKNAEKYFLFHILKIFNILS